MIEKKQATWADIKTNGRSAEELARLNSEVEREAETIRGAADMPSLTSPDGRVTIMAPESMTLGEVTQALLSIPAFGAVLTLRHDDRAIINPPDLGHEATSEIRSRIGLPVSDRGIITPPDMGRPGPDALTRGAERGAILGPPDLGRPVDKGIINPPDMERPAVSPDAVARLAARFDAADPKWHRLHEEVQRRFSAEGEGEAPDTGRWK